MRLSGRLSSFAILLGITLVALVCVVSSARGKQPQRQEPTLGLQIKLSDGQIRRHPLYGRGGGLITRSQLKVVDESAAGDFTAVDLSSEIETGAVMVSLFVIYNDTTKQEWWKDKKQKAAGSYLIHEGESVRTAGLGQFGIEPLELSAIDARPVVIGPSERPYITNKTQSLEVIRLERSLDDYHLTLKNVGQKTIARYTVWHDGSGTSSGALAPGSLHEVPLGGPGIEQEGITISTVVFEDGSFEGDAQKEALGFLAEREGQKIQAPSVLARILETMQAPDAELPTAFEKLEGGLWTIPEAINKPSALELLKSEYPYLDDKSFGQLYEQLKAGLYNARNQALGPLGDLKRRLSEQASGQYNKAADIRRVLNSIKKQLEGIIAAGPR